MSEQVAQTKAIETHLRSGLKITAIQALRSFGVLHLPRRILDLKQKGISIQDNWIDVKKTNGKTARIKEYFI